MPIYSPLRTQLLPQKLQKKPVLVFFPQEIGHVKINNVNDELKQSANLLSKVKPLLLDKLYFCCRCDYVVVYLHASCFFHGFHEFCYKFSQEISSSVFYQKSVFRDKFKLSTSVCVIYETQGRAFRLNSKC